MWSHLCQSHHAASLETGSNISLPFALNCSCTNKESPGKGVSPAQKVVQFDLITQDDLGDTLQLPTNSIIFLKWPEGATNEQCDAQSSPTPMATCPLVRLKMTVPNRENDQQHSTTAKRATPRSQHHPIHQACNKEGLTHTLHNAGLNEMAQGVGQGIH